jgi:hypothetical protein
MGWSSCSNGQATTCKIKFLTPNQKAEGRPKLRWEDGVNNDVQALWERNWKNLATNK